MSATEKRFFFFVIVCFITRIGMAERHTSTGDFVVLYMREISWEWAN